MTPRLDALRIDTSRLDGNAGREAPSVEGTRRRNVDRPRLNGLERPSARAGKAPDGATETQTRDADGSPFITGLGAISLDDALEDFVVPDIPDPTIIRRSLSILQHCVEHLVPDLDGGEQLHDLATALLEDEIELHKELLRLMQEGANSD
ncbi:hypothetical protein [Nitratireductor soli]|uniref:hypothetical protein n=1 Tax=Nitratireductor soli TaxID=1670619 RepID=UPI00065DD217|nr:hypothetical protein [Nitratireductor soli]